MKQTVYLEDRGQDFLEWDIEDGVVVGCRPFQAWSWKGTKVHNESIQPGDILSITPPVTGVLTTLNYPVERVITQLGRAQLSTYHGAMGQSQRGVDCVCGGLSIFYSWSWAGNGKARCWHCGAGISGPDLEVRQDLRKGSARLVEEAVSST